MILKINLLYTNQKKNTINYFLENFFRKLSFREGQLQIINRILQCKNVIGILPTGGGKSLTYQISTLLQPGITIVVDPIRSLMKDQHEKLRENFIDKVVYINSDDDTETRQKKENLISKGEFQYIIVGPERFQIQEFRNYLSSLLSNKLHFSYLVIDEAHCISEWGHDFRYAYLRLSEIVLKNCFYNNPKEFVQIALTATASFDVMADIQREINVENDSILQPPDLDRNELHFKAFKFNPPNLDKTKNHIIKDGFKDYLIERKLAEIKYPYLKKLLTLDIPKRIEELNINNGNSKITKENFWKPVNGIYPNAGIIYCPTKSDSKGNGAYAVCYHLFIQNSEYIVEKGLETEDYLEKATYFGGGDENSWENIRINNEAKKATENQTKFMQNKLNLIVATKAFGMGLDKPNVRFTIHYSLPTSIEAFYQEAGRAGRDGTHSLNYILYSPTDLESNLDNIKNAHKGILREFIIFNELLTEIRYEDNFGLKILNSKFQQQFPKYYLNKSVNDKGNCYIYINERKTTNKNNLIAKLYLKIDNNINIYTDNSIISNEEAERVANELLFILKNLVNGSNFIEFLHIKQSDGIETMLQNSTGELKIFIGFNNQVIQDLGRKIGDRRIGKEKIIPGERVVRSAYNFCDAENGEKMETQFIKNLEYQYERDNTIPKFQDIGINIEYFKNSFWNIRNSKDTQRAMYRLNILGVIDDYTVDYGSGIFEIIITRKENGFYYNKLKDYLLKYLGETETENIIERTKKRNSEYDTTELRKCLNELTEFFTKAITQKRIHSAKYVKEAIDVNDESEFRKKINNYFASKYASDFYNDFGINKNSNINLIEKYLSLIKNPDENNPGLEIDNLKHLIGACDRYEVDSKTKEDGIVSILKNISLMIIDLKNNKNEKGNKYWKSIFEILLNIEQQNKIPNSQLIEILNSIEKYVVDIEPKTKFYIYKIKEAVYLNILNNKMLKFNQKYLI